MTFKNVTVFAGLLSACVSAFCANPFDLNLNGKIDGRDVNQVATSLAGYVRQGGYTPPSGSPLLAYDFNGDKTLNLSDWQAYIDYVKGVATSGRSLFDVDGNDILDGVDRNRIAAQMAIGPLSPPSDLRYDFNGDGRNDAKDWNIFLSYMKKTNPSVLIDFNNDGVVNSTDAAMLAQQVDSHSYNVAYDLNADGVVDARDWQVGLSLFRQVAPKSLFAVSRVNVIGGNNLTSQDSLKIAQTIGGAISGGYSSIRYDFNGDGVVDINDWKTWVQFASIEYQKSSVIFDVNGDGWVDPSDVAEITANALSNPGALQYDVNGDGVVNQADIVLLSNRVRYGLSGPLVGDVNRDGCVNANDVTLVQSKQNVSQGQAQYDVDYDLDMSGFIDQRDLSYFNSYPTQQTNWSVCQ